MMKNLSIIFAAGMLLFAITACDKKEAKTAETGTIAKGPIIDDQTPTDLTHGASGSSVKKTNFQIVVPPEVTKEWKAVTFTVDDRKEKTKKDITVTIGDETMIPGSSLTVKTGPFLPDFKMSGEIITSLSSKPDNPAVGVAVFEDGKQIFPASGQWGWIYKNFPTIHPFEHERYGLALKEGVKK